MWNSELSSYDWDPFCSACIIIRTVYTKSIKIQQVDAIQWLSNRITFGFLVSCFEICNTKLWTLQKYIFFKKLENMFTRIIGLRTANEIIKDNKKTLLNYKKSFEDRRMNFLFSFLSKQIAIRKVEPTITYCSFWVPPLYYHLLL